MEKEEGGKGPPWKKKKKICPWGYRGGGGGGGGVGNDGDGLVQETSSILHLGTVRY